MSLGQLVVELQLDGSNFTVNLKKADGALGAFILGANKADAAANRAEKSTRHWGRAVRDLVITFALARDAIRTLQEVTIGWQRAIVATNSEVQRSIELMKNFSRQTDPVKAAAEAIADVQKTLDRAASAPFNLSAITDTFVKLRVAGLEPADRALNTLIDSVAAFGGSNDNLKRAGVAIQQMAGKGVVSMEELRQQLGESVPTAITAMADALGTTYNDLVKQISLGRVSSEPALIAMMGELELSFKGRAAAMMDTWGGAVAQFETGLKRLSLAFGGLEEDGFAGDGYMKTITSELKELNEVLQSPASLNSARQLGQALAELIVAVADGVHWLIEHRTQILALAKALGTLWLAYKGASLIGGALSAMGGILGRLSTATIALTASQTSLAAGMRASMLSMSGWNSASVLSAAQATRLATGSTIAATAVRGLGGAIAVALGPLGMIAALVAAAGFAMLQYKNDTDQATKAVLEMNGALTDNAQLQTLLDHRQKLREEAENFKPGAFAVFGKATNSLFGDSAHRNSANFKAAARANAEEREKIEKDLSKARISVAESLAAREVNHEVQLIENKVSELSRQYNLGKEKLRSQMKEEADKDGKLANEQKFKDALIDMATSKIDGQIALYTQAKEEAQKTIDQFENSGLKLDTLPQEKMIELRKAQRLVGEFSEKLNQSHDELDRLAQRKTLEEILTTGASAGKKEFDGLSIFVDGLRKKLATLDAKMDDTNPHLAQLQATIESLDGKKGANFDKNVESAKRYAAELWELEKRKKELSEANAAYAKSLERTVQIDRLAGAKLNKVDSDNPWLKASQDAIRYREELEELNTVMQQSRATATAQGDLALIKQIDEALPRIDEAKRKLDQLSVSDAAKSMREQTRDITQGLMTQTEQAKTAYQEQMAWMEEYYAKHQQLLTQDAQAMLAYNDLRAAQEAQYRRNTESGLEEWIRLNKDATDKYKQLWGSAMDKFNDTLVEGMKTGKLEIGTFVEYVLEEFLRIQMAKQMAAMADTIGGSGGGGWLGAIGSAVGSMFGGGSAGGTATPKAQKFATGGIMTKYGRAQLNTYANGGIADRPQVAIFGEGDRPEAYVPLPDGRTIPVTLKGGQQGQQAAPAAAPKVEINLFNQSGEQVGAETTGQKFDGEKFVVDVLLKAVARPGPVRDAIRGA